jgi:hypothetical protein
VDYTALSHCWGKQQVITTTLATLSSRKEGIPWKELSKTFQDAICITRKLGYGYIWIDSLCIIQNDHLDWETEAKNMGSIYEGAVVTIAALKAHDGTEGCFIDTEGLEGKEVLISKDLPYRPTGICVQRRPGHIQFSDIMTHDYGTPLFKRAWTLQEELLSKRVIYFSDDEVVWQCWSKIDCQCGWIEKDFKSLQLQSSKTGYATVLSSESEKPKSTAEWSRIVMQYSGRALTKETDRFPALSGLAKAFQRPSTGRYVAGLWSSDLPLSLLWRTLSNIPSRKSSTYIAPSWSWASLPSGPQAYLDSQFFLGQEKSDFAKYVSKILDVYCESAGFDPTGELKSGYLKVLAPMVDVELSAADRSAEPRLRRKGHSIVWWQDYPFEELGEWHGHLVQILLICTLKVMDHFIVLVPSRRGRTLKRIGTGSVEVIRGWFENEILQEVTII